MLRFHNSNHTVFAELPDTESIVDIDTMLDIMADARYNGSGIILLHARSLPEGFLDLRTGIAGEVLQKFSNYRMKLAIIGDFTGIKSRSLSDFIRESNRTGHIVFVSSVEEAICRIGDTA